MGDVESYRVPVIDPKTGEGWDVDVEAESPEQAMKKATDEADQMVYISSTFVKKHIEEDDG